MVKNGKIRFWEISKMGERGIRDEDWMWGLMVRSLV